MDAKGKAPMPIEDLEKDGAADEQEDEEDEDESNDRAADSEEGDMQLAWEMLEVARTIYTKGGGSCLLQLAGGKLRVMYRKLHKAYAV